jgi:hypothetical protein
VLDGRLDFAKTKGAMRAAGAGIYELKGDTLKVCYGSERPAEFKTKPDSSQKLYVFKREKPKKADTKPGVRPALRAPGWSTGFSRSGAAPDQAAAKKDKKP